MSHQVPWYILVSSLSSYPLCMRSAFIFFTVSTGTELPDWQSFLAMVVADAAASGVHARSQRLCRIASAVLMAALCWPSMQGSPIGAAAAYIKPLFPPRSEQASNRKDEGPPRARRWLQILRRDNGSHAEATAIQPEHSLGQGWAESPEPNHETSLPNRGLLSAFDRTPPRSVRPLAASPKTTPRSRTFKKALEFAKNNHGRHPVRYKSAEKTPEQVAENKLASQLANLAQRVPESKLSRNAKSL